eukprot:130427-Rhodomonas_salina.4
MSGSSFLKKQLRGKKIGAGIQCLGMAESTDNGQYLFNAAVDQNTAGVKGYRIAADNLFNSVDTCKKVGAAGHTIYGTMRPDGGVTLGGWEGAGGGWEGAKGAGRLGFSA